MYLNKLTAPNHGYFIYNNQTQVLELTPLLVNGLGTDCCGIRFGVEAEAEQLAQGLTCIVVFKKTTFKKKLAYL